MRQDGAVEDSGTRHRARRAGRKRQGLEPAPAFAGTEVRVISVAARPGGRSGYESRTMPSGSRRCRRRRRRPRHSSRQLRSERMQSSRAPPPSRCVAPRGACLRGPSAPLRKADGPQPEARPCRLRPAPGPERRVQLSNDGSSCAPSPARFPPVSLSVVDGRPGWLLRPLPSAPATRHDRVAGESRVKRVVAVESRGWAKFPGFAARISVDPHQRWAIAPPAVTGRVPACRSPGTYARRARVSGPPAVASSDGRRDVGGGTNGAGRPA